MGSGVAPFEIVHERQTVDPKFGNERAGVVSPLKLLVENVVLNEDVGHHSRISSREDDANKSNLLFFDGLPPSKTEDKEESVMELTESYSCRVSLEHSQVSDLELGPMLKENSKDIKYEEDAMQVVSYSRVLEEDIGLEVAPFEIVNGSKIHDSKSNGVGAVSPVNLLVANVGLTEDFGDQDTSLTLHHHSRFPSGDSEDFGDQDTSLSLEHHSRFPSKEDDANKSNLFFSECLHFSESEDKQELVTKLTEASTLEVGLEHSQVSNLELRPILEENLEDIKFEEDAMKVVSYSRVLEEDMGLEVAPLEIVHESKIHEPKSNNGGASAVSPLNFLVENDRLVEDFGNQDTSLPLDHHSEFPLGEDGANKSNLLFSDGLPPSETEDKHELVTKLIEASNLGVGLEHSQVNNLELRLILEENVEDIKFKEVVSYSRVLEKDMGLEEASVEIVHGRKIQDPASSNIRSGEVSPYVDLLAKEVGLNKDFSDQDTSLVLDPDLRFSSTEDDANRSNRLFSVGLSSSELEDKQLLVMQLTEANAFGVGLEHSQVSNLELRPILGENMEDFKLEEEHVNLLKSTSSMPEEPNVGLFSCGQDSSFQNNTKEP
ncbi:hypothetical protein HPP92_008477 [Vanilla planifolia]|uniref:Uncharacterized protein n=1 Tax=Vanilla planifolia TaxID=51239 RepID=A0A835RDE2_VANPL|nr:hypothetical protein HPP92_008477 [Vanilla planifolia]